MDVLYLVPHPECPAATAALDFPHNRPHVGLYHFGFNDTVRCFKVAIPDSSVHASTEWMFKIANHTKSDIYLPQTSVAGPFALCLAFWIPLYDTFAFPSTVAWTEYDGDEPPAVTIIDPLHAGEVGNASEDVILEMGRHVKNPEQIIVGPYRYMVFQPTIQLDYAERRPLAMPTDIEVWEFDWRPTGRHLGEGSFGTVTAVQGHCTGQVRACKRVQVLCADEEGISDVRNEIAVMKRLAGHPHLLQCFTSSETKRIDGRGTKYIDFTFQSPLCHGDLATLIKDDLALKFLPLIANQIISAISHMHSLKIVHRDIKPANILVRLIGRGELNTKLADELADDKMPTVMFILADFGLARLRAKDEIIISRYLGTPLLMAPEQGSGRGYDHAVDIWSIASVFLEVICPREYTFIDTIYSQNMRGEEACPYQAAMNEHRYRFSNTQNNKNPLAKHISQMLSPDPYQRPIASALKFTFKNLDWPAIMESACHMRLQPFHQGYAKWLYDMRPEIPTDDFQLVSSHTDQDLQDCDAEPQDGLDRGTDKARPVANPLEGQAECKPLSTISELWPPSSWEAELQPFLATMPRVLTAAEVEPEMGRTQPKESAKLDKTVTAADQPSGTIKLSGKKRLEADKGATYWFRPLSVQESVTLPLRSVNLRPNLPVSAESPDPRKESGSPLTGEHSKDPVSGHLGQKQPVSGSALLSSSASVVNKERFRQVQKQVVDQSEIIQEQGRQLVELRARSDERDAEWARQMASMRRKLNARYEPSGGRPEATSALGIIAEHGREQHKRRLEESTRTTAANAASRKLGNTDWKKFIRSDAWASGKPEDKS